MNKNITKLAKVYLETLEITVWMKVHIFNVHRFKVLQYLFDHKMELKILRKVYNVRASVGSEHMACISVARASKTKKYIINTTFCRFNTQRC